jgi:hypothetical protein
VALMTGPLSPYVTPDELTAAPTGISWQTIPGQQSSEAQKYAEQVNICQRATSMVDSHCNQVLRCTVQTETLYGPGYRMTVHSSGMTRLLLSQWPITAVTSIQVAQAAVFPRQWTTVANNAFAVERPTLFLPNSSAPIDSATGGQAVLLGPGYVSGGGGHGAFVTETTYSSGWPHAGIAQAASVGDAILYVDDCTGWAPVTVGGQGATGVIHDTGTTPGSGQEAVTCLASSVTTGPGILTLASPLQYAHSPGVIVTTMADQVQWATILFCVSLALTRGATATMIQTMGGGGGKTASGAADMRMEACELLRPFRRVT